MKDFALLFLIAYKDMLRSFRSAFALAFMFAIPILVTVMFSFMFGGGDEGPQFSLPVTRVVVADLDEGSPQFTASLKALPQASAGAGEIDGEQAGSLGALLAQTLQSESLAELMETSLAGDATEARHQVDQQFADVAVIIPPEFTQTLMQSGKHTEVELYYDPTLSLGPQVVGSIVDGFIDQILIAPLGIQVIQQQLADQGLALTGAQIGELVARLALVDHQEALVESQAGAETASQSTSPAGDFTRRLLTLIMGGMMVFYAFFTGANSVQSILEEEDKGTLGRMFTTPVPVWCVLGGKFLAAGLTVLVQVVLLMVFGTLVFGIQWGSLASAGIAGLGLVLASATAGIFLVSLLKNRNQTGIIFGGVMTLTGMVGIFSVFTQGAASSRITETFALVVPQGWTMTLLRRAVEGATPLDLAPYLLGVLGWSVVFFGVGVLRFRRRYG